MSRREARYRLVDAAAQASLGAERPVLLADANGEHGAVEEAEYQRRPGKAEDQRKHGDLGGHHPIVRMIDEAVGAGADERFAGKHYDSSRPATAQGDQDPGAHQLDEDEQREPETVNRARWGQPPKAGQPQRVHRDDQRIVARSMFARALLKKAAGVAVRMNELDQPLQRDEREDRDA